MILFLAAAAPAAAQDRAAAGALEYQLPPAPIVALFEAPSPPVAVLGPDRDTLALLSRPGLPPIAELAEPELGLAGLTINPRNNGPSRTSAYDGVTLRSLSDGRVRAASLPPAARLIAAAWSPDGRRLAFLLLGDEEVALWTVEAATGAARRLVGGVNAALPRAFEWLPDSSSLIVRLVPPDRGAPPPPDPVPSGPIVRESRGAAAASQTLRNLLSGPRDAALFEHYFTSQLARVGLDGAPPRPVGAPGIVTDVAVSPDGLYLLQHRLKRPYSLALPASAFPTEIIVTDLDGRGLRTIADRPALASPSAIPAGPRAVQWRADAPATLVWAEAGQGGEGDRLLRLPAPFTGDPEPILAIDQRFQSVLWGRDDFALLIAAAPEERREYRIAFDPRRPGSQRVLQRRDYGGGAEAGTPLVRTGPNGRERLHLTPDGSAFFVRTRSGLGRVALDDGSVETLWREAPGESLFALLDPAGRKLATWRQSRTEPLNLFVVDRAQGEARRVTDFADPAPAFAEVAIRPSSYRRADGVALHGTLYLPAGHDPARDGPLPTLVWAYPASVDAAELGGRARPSDTRFVRPHGFDDLPLLLLSQGYAVFEAGMPIVGTQDRPANDSHVPQLVANAEAAVGFLVESGVAAPGRIAIAGHSYGAAMVANLLAHSDVFAAGIALSGAYNRTLTPFGFQASESRSFWEAPEAYLAMSPFIHADRIDEPLLLVHGAADPNSGTLPMQSERLFAAIQGTGGNARYVLLPHEGHQYRARESLMHLMWEMTRWLDLHIRGAQAD